MSRFIVLPARILEDKRLSSATHLRVLMYLGLRADKHGWCFPSRKDIAAKVGGITPARVSQCMRDLSEWGYVEIHSQSRDSDGGQTSNAYRILFDIGAPVDEAAEADKDDHTPVRPATPPVSKANSRKKRSTPVSQTNPPVSRAERGGKSHGVIRGGKSLAFTPVVNDPSNDPNKKSSSNARDEAPVDNSAAAAAALNSKTGKPNAEREMLELLASFPRCVIDAARDRVHVLAWVGKGVAPDQLREAHRRAAVARDRDESDLPVNAGFLSRFVDEVMAVRTATAASDGPWWRGSEEVVISQGAELGVRPKKADEHWHWYRVLVAAASRESGAVEFVLADAKKFNDERLYQFARATFGDALMPVDDYAS